ncbi:hypothetical protein MNBD_PLANCTO03-901, partial [hydrothermal vent metagenome]
MRTHTVVSIVASLVALTASAGLAQSQGNPALHHLSEFKASTFTMSSQGEPALAVAPDGSFAVVWSSRRQQEGRYGVYMQRFDSRGVAVGLETPLNLWTASHVLSPVIDIARDGSAWTAWQSAGQDGHAGAIIARHFDATGVGGAEILANDRTEGEQAGPIVA